MTIEEITSRVEAIRVLKDNEHQHRLEDELRADFIEYVATLEIPIAQKAKAVMKTDEFPFCRWYA